MGCHAFGDAPYGRSWAADPVARWPFARVGLQYQRLATAAGAAGVRDTIVRSNMPRPTKVFRRQKLNAAAAWKRGDKKEAYKLWEKAAASLKEHRAKKHNKNKPAEVAESSKGGG